jgi:membrane protein implicated in regulation of membrane protease activity
MIIEILSKPEVFWFAIGLICLLFELMMPGFFIFFFGVGAWTTAIVCFFGAPSINVQIIIFLTVSILSLLAFRKMLYKKFLFPENEKSKNIEDEFIGREAVAITDFDSDNRGRVEFKGTSWKAEANRPIKAGQVVKIIDKYSITLKIELKND